MATPEIRFKGFDGGWDSKQLSEVSSRVSRVNPESTAPVMMISASQGFINQSEKYVYDNAGKSLTKYIEMKAGELAYNHGASKLRKFGSTFALKTATALVPFVYHCFTTPQENSNFIGQQLNHPRMQSQLGRLVSSGARLDGLLNISFEAFTTVKVNLPKRNEQDRISELFRELDDLVEATQAKLGTLRNLKQTMLVKMFPQPGNDRTNVPEIRFAGFEGEWELNKLSDHANFNKGTGYSKKDLQSSGSPIVLYGRLYTNFEAEINNVDTFVTEFGPSIRSKGNEVIVPASGESAEEIARASAVKQKGVILAGDLNIITPSPRFDSLFLALSISNGRSYNDLVRRAQGATIVHLRNSDLKELEIATPSLPEQEAIGNYFRNLDELITAEVAKLTKLTQLKSALLDGMFV